MTTHHGPPNGEQTDAFAEAEAYALERPELPSDAIPHGIPDDEAERILKWRAANSARARGVLAAAKADGEVELSIIGVIGGGWLGDGISAKSVKRWLDENRSAKTIRVLIDSPGGDYFDGVAIMNQLKRASARVVTEVIGEASSAGSVIAMGGDEIEMHDGTVMMVHRAWSIALGNADELRTSAAMLDRVDDGLKTLYTARTGRPRDEIETLVNATTFMSAKEAVDEGFADRVLPAKAKPKPAKPASASARAAAVAPQPGPRVAAMRRDEPEPSTPDPAAGEAVRTEDKPMTFPKDLLKILNLSDDADETAVVAAARKLKSSAEAGTEIEKIVGAVGAGAIGAVRALKDHQEATVELAADVGKLKVTMNRREFDAARADGLREERMNSTQAKRYSDNFEKEVSDGGDGSRTLDEMKGHLSVTPKGAFRGRIVPPAPDANGGGSVPHSHNGKPFEAMRPMDRKILKDQNPELYTALRDDAVARGVI